MREAACAQMVCVIPPTAPPVLPVLLARYELTFKQSKGQKTRPLPQLLLPAHRPALLGAGAVGALPNPLQAKQVNTFLSAIRVALEGTNREQEVAGGDRIFP